MQHLDQIRSTVHAEWQLVWNQYVTRRKSVCNVRTDMTTGDQSYADAPKVLLSWLWSKPGLIGLTCTMEMDLTIGTSRV